ncbi:hypothetical protein GLOIN_2v1687198 [Rhizophagus irregularis DAOM 181602=DAOM 197198]|nr:hypothetical protein GLOIN_2v1687198 [Rhizophagus irregularis DAOM 181602=DAOM 197198]
MSSKFWAGLSNDYEKILESGFGYDVIIYVGEEPNVKEFHLHSSILCYRSQYFYAAFSNEWAEKKDGKFILRKPNISPQLFNIILRFIYCGNIELNNLQVESKHVLLFASWIDKKDSSYYNKEKIPYDFNLLYRSNDRFDAKSFHRNCDNKGATIWIAKIQGSTQLIGGYNPLDWSGNGPKITLDSFLFNFTDGKNISNAKSGYVNDKNNAIYCYNHQGPSMGDLYCPDFNSWKYSYSGNYYPSIGIPRNFDVEDFEVFQVIKR